MGFGFGGERRPARRMPGKCRLNHLICVRSFLKSPFLMTRTSHAATISEIYAAFDPAMTAVYQAAIAFSQGGILRVADLQAALSMSGTSPVRDFTPPVWNESARPRVSHNRGPLTNEPALREVLRSAYDLAKQLTPESPRLTPTIALASALATTSSPARSANDWLQQLTGQSLCQRTHRHLRESPPHLADSPRLSFDPKARRIVLEQMDDVFEKWLELQLLTTGPASHQDRATLATLTAQIEHIG